MNQVLVNDDARLLTHVAPFVFVNDMATAIAHLNTAYLLRETFDQLWDYNSKGWARRFFDNWKAQFRWQRLDSYEKFAAVIECHWGGIAAYC